MSEDLASPTPEVSFTPDDLYFIDNLTQQYKQIRRGVGDPVEQKSLMWRTLDQHAGLLDQRAYAGQDVEAIRLVMYAESAGAMAYPEDAMGAAEAVKRSPLLTEEESQTFHTVASGVANLRVANVPETTVVDQGSELFWQQLTNHRDATEATGSDGRALELALLAFHNGLTVAEHTMQPQDTLVDAMRRSMPQV